MIRKRNGLPIRVGLAMVLLAPLKVGLRAPAPEPGPYPGKGAQGTGIVWAEAAKGPEASSSSPRETVLSSAARGDWDAAIPRVVEEVVADWKNPEVWATFTAVLSVGQKQGPEKVAERMETALRQKIGDDARKWRPIGAAFRKSGFLPQALSLYEELVQEDPLDAEARAGLAEVRLAMGELEAAQAAADRAVGVQGNCAAGHRARAKALLARGFADAAGEPLDRAERLEPHRADVRGMRAQRQLLRGNEDPAEKWIEAAWQADPEEPEAWFAQGLLQSLRGEKAAAQRAWRQYLAVDSASERAHRVRWGVVVAGVRRISPQGYYTFPAWSPDGQQIAVCAGGWGGDLQVMPADGSEEPVVIAEGGLPKQYPSWSPDGQQLVYSELRPQTPDGIEIEAELYIQEAVPGAVPRRLAENFAVAAAGRWNPVQDLLVFRGRSQPDDLLLLHLLHPDGSGLVTVPTSRRLPSHMPAVNWSPDGQRIVTVQITRWDPKTVRIFTMSLEETPAPQTLLEEPGMHVHPCFSPDGDKVLFTSDRSGDPGVWDLWVTRVSEEGPPLRLLPLAHTYQPTADWSPQGDSLVYCDGGGEPGVYVATLAGLRTILQLRLPKGSEIPVGEGQQAELSLPLSLRNLTPQDQETTLEVQLFPQGGAPIPLRTLTVPGQGEVQQTLIARPGRRGEYRAVVTATGSEFAVQRETTLQVIEGWDEKKCVVVRPFFAVENYQADRDAVAAGIWRLVMEKLYRLWQLRVANVRSGWDWSVLAGSNPASVIVLENREGERNRQLLQPGEALPPVVTEKAHAAILAQAYPTSDYVVCGTVTADPQSIQTQLILVDVAAGQILPDSGVEMRWPRSQLPHLAGELARRICEVLAIPLEPAQAAWLQAPPTANSQALEAYGRAVMPVLRGKGSEATPALLESLAADPQFALGHREFGGVLQRQNQRPEALTEWQAALALDPGDPLVRADLLEVSFYGKETPDRRKMAQEAVFLDPYNPTVLRALGDRLSREPGNDEKVARLLQRSLRDPYQHHPARKQTERVLGILYARVPRLDPRLRVSVDLPAEATPVQALVSLLAQASRVPLAVIAPGIGEQAVTLDPSPATVGQALEALAQRVGGQWNRTPEGYFLTQRGVAIGRTLRSFPRSKPGVRF